MAVYYVTRHRDAIDWLKSQKDVPEADAIIDDFQADFIRPGDMVIGILPVHIAADVCAKGGRYFHLALLTPREKRGQELTVVEMDRFEAALEEYLVERKDA